MVQRHLLFKILVLMMTSLVTATDDGSRSQNTALAKAVQSTHSKTAALTAGVIQWVVLNSFSGGSCSGPPVSVTAAVLDRCLPSTAGGSPYVKAIKSSNTVSLYYYINSVCTLPTGSGIPLTLYSCTSMLISGQQMSNMYNLSSSSIPTYGAWGILQT